jgi:hypothetical protein
MDEQKEHVEIDHQERCDRRMREIFFIADSLEKVASFIHILAASLRRTYLESYPKKTK